MAKELDKKEIESVNGGSNPPNWFYCFYSQVDNGIPQYHSQSGFSSGLDCAAARQNKKNALRTEFGSRVSFYGDELYDLNNYSIRGK